MGMFSHVWTGRCPRVMPEVVFSMHVMLLVSGGGAEGLRGWNMVVALTKICFGSQQLLVEKRVGK